MTSGTRVAITGFHDGNAGQVAEWFESVTGFVIDCFVASCDEPAVIDVAAENRRRVSQKLEYPGVSTFKGRPLIWRRDWVPAVTSRGVRHILPMDSVNSDRWRTIQMARDAGLTLVSAIHPSATLLDQCEIEPGVWINACAFVGYKAEIKSGAMINTAAVIEHHNVIESCAQVDPAAAMAGNVTLRARSHVHLGARIINRVEIGEDAIVGAGALVRHSVPARTTVVGVPARVLRRDENQPSAS